MVTAAVRGTDLRVMFDAGVGSTAYCRGVKDYRYHFKVSLT